MSNGRMTFRFDTGQGKGKHGSAGKEQEGQKGQAEHKKSPGFVHGSLGTARDYGGGKEYGAEEDKGYATAVEDGTVPDYREVKGSGAVQDSGIAGNYGRGNPDGSSKDYSKVKEYGRAKDAWAAEEDGDGKDSWAVNRYGKDKDSRAVEEYDKSKDYGVVKELGRGKDSWAGEEYGKGKDAWAVKRYGKDKEYDVVKDSGKSKDAWAVKRYGKDKEYDVVKDSGAPLHRSDVPVVVQPYNAAGGSGVREQYGHTIEGVLEEETRIRHYGDRDDPGRGSEGSASFFRPEPVTDLWERKPSRRTAEPVTASWEETPPGRTVEAAQERGYRQSAGYPELTGDDEPVDFGDISYSGLSYGGGGSYQTRRPTRWWKFALSIAGALGTGLLLGYAALNFISGVNDSGGGANPAAVQTAGGGSNGQPVAADTGLPSAGSDAGRIPVAVAAQSYYLLQYGVFSSPAGAQQAQEELLAAGLAAGADPDGGNRVYAGVSPDREQAKLLSSGLKHQGIELYVREMTLPAMEQAAFSGDAEAVNRYFAASDELLDELSSLSASLLSGAGGAADTTAVSDLHMQWSEAVKALEPGLSEQGQSLCASLQKAMSQGIAALNEYNKNQAQGLLWEVQESMMSFLTGQKTLLSLLA